MASPSAPSWRNPRVLRILVVVFLCGVSMGMLVVALVLGRWTYASQPAWRESGKEITLQRFKKELNLTPAQAQQLETVLDDFFMYYHTLQAQLDDVRATGKKRILRLLDEEQKRKFEKLTAELQAKLR